MDQAFPQQLGKISLRTRGTLPETRQRATVSSAKVNGQRTDGKGDEAADEARDEERNLLPRALSRESADV
jgi:hypothetical protein